MTYLGELQQQLDSSKPSLKESDIENFTWNDFKYSEIEMYLNTNKKDANDIIIKNRKLREIQILEDYSEIEME